MKYLYKALSKERQVVHGTFDAKDTNEVVKYLRRHQMTPINIVAEDSLAVSRLLNIFRRVTNNDVVFFTRQLSSILSSGLTLVQALGILRAQVQSASMANIVGSIVTDIEGGETFSAALEKYPEVFSPIYISLVRAAESSGLLDKILLRMADNLEKQQKLIGTIRSALLYPAIVMVFMVGVFIIISIMVIPTLSHLYADLQFPIPPAMQFMIFLSKFLTLFWPFLLAAIVLLPLGYRLMYKTKQGRLLVDTIGLHTPVFGMLIRHSVMADFARTFGLLVGAGTPVVEALNKSADVVGNIYYQNAIALVAKKVEKGVSIGDAMTDNLLFSPMIIEMVKIGEQTGKIDDSLLRTADYYEREVDGIAKSLTTLLEPFIMIFLAIGVAFLVYVVITPIYKLISQIGS